eukprot:308278_1
MSAELSYMPDKLSYMHIMNENNDNNNDELSDLKIETSNDELSDLKIENNDNNNDEEFNIFGWHINDDNADRSIEQKSNKTQKSTSSKMWRNLVKKKGTHHVGGYDRHKNSMDMIFQNNKP